MDLATVLYEVDGPVATITMNRPEVANAQDTALIDDMDAAFDAADADDDGPGGRSSPAPGKHFSSGHDLKALVGQGEADDRGCRMRETPEGKFRHEQVMYFERCMRIYDFRKPTIAAVQGSCIAAGLMLACMCDLIVAADDAVFPNPVLRMTGAGVELLVEPWELGIRKAKEFLLDRREDRRRRRRGGSGWSTGSCPPAELMERDTRAGRQDRAGAAGHGAGGQGHDQPHRRR